MKALPAILPEKMGPSKAIFQYFAMEGKPLTVRELAQVSAKDRKELALLAAEALGVELEEVG